MAVRRGLGDPLRTALQGSDPLDLLLDEDGPPQERQAPQSGSRRSPAPSATQSRALDPAAQRPLATAVSESREGDRRDRTTKIPAVVPIELLERARDVVFWTPGLTLAELVTEALAAELDRHEKARGSRFPPRTGRIRPGRPIR